MSVLITINLPQLCTSYVHTVCPFNVVLLDKIVTCISEGMVVGCDLGGG